MTGGFDYALNTSNTQTASVVDQVMERKQLVAPKCGSFIFNNNKHLDSAQMFGITRKGL